MNRWTGLFSTLLVLFVAAGAARADMMTQWTYSWSRTPTGGSVASDLPQGTGGISLTLSNPMTNSTTVGDSDIVAVNLSTFSSAPTGTRDTFTHTPYSLTIHLTDKASGASKDLTFNGEFDGTLSQTQADIHTTFLDPSVQQAVLGQHTYTVALNSFVAPGLPSSTTFGSIGAHVSVSDSQGVDTVPEPSTLLLAGLTVPAGLVWWRARRARPAAAD